ncbi:MAG: DUF523 domain-containing protein [Chloroflexi bacterium]|jgi:uncharacterized protein YbbK (DUF523 family)|nr:DUF523 domain-containing protein [Chloroflexota bacterium]MBT7080807.1 DUF523 domain-containing protein [Chloroflexota bacterium]MBT7289953.1 DUF523 domain-containing protein [Chloroflexota bacterium]
MKLISMCLLGKICNWRGDDRYKSLAALRLAEHEQLLSVCPEQLAQMLTPRPQMEIVGGTGQDVLDSKARVMTIDGVDVTASLIAGAKAALKQARDNKATVFIGKARSPSCGRGMIYDGTFSGKTTPGDGVTSALLKRHGISVITNDQL